MSARSMVRQNKLAVIVAPEHLHVFPRLEVVVVQQEPMVVSPVQPPFQALGWVPSLALLPAPLPIPSLVLLQISFQQLFRTLALFFQPQSSFQALFPVLLASLL